MSLQSARNLLPRTIVLMALAVLAACATQDPMSSGNRPATGGISSRSDGNALGERAAQIAVRQIGVPYRYGGMSSDGFDCSGLVHFSYARAGKVIPRTTTGLWRKTQPLTERELQAGDVLFFYIQGKMSHVGMYIGDRRFVHAPKSGRRVSIESLDSDFYSQAFVRGGRP
jgi:cell wall-associated NlpC family hydrolase